MPGMWRLTISLWIHEFNEIALLLISRLQYKSMCQVTGVNNWYYFLLDNKWSRIWLVWRHPARSPSFVTAFYWVLNDCWHLLHLLLSIAFLVWQRTSVSFVLGLFSLLSPFIFPDVTFSPCFHLFLYVSGIVYRLHSSFPMSRFTHASICSCTCPE